MYPELPEIIQKFNHLKNQLIKIIALSDSFVSFPQYL